jgi:hypothetical protein
MIDALSELLGPPDHRTRYDDYEMGRWHRADMRRYASVEEWDDGDVLLILDDRQREAASRVQAFECCIASGWPGTDEIAFAVRSFLEHGTIVMLEKEPEPKPLKFEDRSLLRRLIRRFVGGEQAS